MPDSFVLDASAVARIVTTHPDTERFRDWLIERYRGRDRLFAPDLLPHELASLVHREYGPVARSHPADLLQRLVTSAVHGIDLDETAWCRTWPWVGQLSHYDATYLALAVAKQAVLVTYDKQLANVARAHVPVIGVDGLDSVTTAGPDPDP